MTADAEHRDLLAELRSLADPEYREGSRMVAPTAQAVLGVRTPDLRRLARRWRRAHGGRPPGWTLGVVTSLWEGESREERVLAMEILTLHPRIVADLGRTSFDRWRADIDNWGVCDFLGCRILGPWLLEDPRRLPYLEELIGEPDRWSRRLALVATVWLNRRSDGHADLTLALVDRVLGERDPMIVKAISWALREMIRRHRERVEEYVETRDQRLAAVARREVRNKLRTGRKSGRA